MKIADEASMVEAAKRISETFGCATLVKGGHQINDANDLLYRNDSFTWFKGKRIHNSNIHGTGCTLSSAIASNLAKGFDLDASVKRAKRLYFWRIRSNARFGQRLRAYGSFVCDRQ